MLKAIKKLLEHNGLLISLGITVLIIYLSLSSPATLPIQINNSDKIFHAFAYFILSLSWLFTIKKSYHELGIRIIVMAAVVVFGILLEVLQGIITTYRTMDLLDIVANCSGVVLALFSFKFLHKIFRAI